MFANAGQAIRDAGLRVQAAGARVAETAGAAGVRQGIP